MMRSQNLAMTQILRIGLHTVARLDQNQSMRRSLCMDHVVTCVHGSAFKLRHTRTCALKIQADGGAFMVWR